MADAKFSIEIIITIITDFNAKVDKSKLSEYLGQFRFRNVMKEGKHSQFYDN